MDLPTLRTDRLVLRPFVAADAPEVQRLAGDAAVATTTVNIPHPYPDGMAESWIASHAVAWAARTGLTLAVTSGDALRGAVTLQLRLVHWRAELGYWIGRPFWGQGLATEAGAAMLRFAFDTLDIHRVQATHLARNPASGRVMQKLGMTREGLHRAMYVRDGRAEDVVQYAILRSD